MKSWCVPFISAGMFFLVSHLFNDLSACYYLFALLLMNFFFNTLYVGKGGIWTLAVFVGNTRQFFMTAYLYIHTRTHNSIQLNMNPNQIRLGSIEPHQLIEVGHLHSTILSYPKLYCCLPILISSILIL